MVFIKFLCLAAVITVLTVLVCTEKLPVGKRFGAALETALLPHFVMICSVLVTRIMRLEFGFWAVVSAAAAGIYMLGRFIHLSVKPYKGKLRVKARVKALYGGKVLIGCSAFSAVFQIVFYAVMIPNGFFGLFLSKGVLIADSICTYWFLRRLPLTG